jgi:TetR/AcrR family transcriptional regulator, repressor for neighboring sulfatase
VTTTKSTKKTDATKDALIDALIRLLGKRSIGAVSVRDVAAEAGVNHGLVHRHFGSKQALVRAAVARISDEIHADAGPGLSSRSFETVRRHPALARALARACLDGPADVVALAGPRPAELDAIVAPVREALERAGLARRVDAHVLNAFIASGLVGWFVFRPLLRAYGIPRDADDRLAELMRLLDELSQRG